MGHSFVSYLESEGEDVEDYLQIIPGIYNGDGGGDECFDTDNGATDAYGDGCDDYTAEAATGWSSGYGNWCANYDDEDFTANDMCCTCDGDDDGDGGGDECFDTDDGAADAYGDGCDDYTAEAATGWSSGYGNWCANYDDEDFTANDMCCTCDGDDDSGGGGCGDCCGGIMNSAECSTAVATDGGPWWIGDRTYSEPSGNWDGGCFLAKGWEGPPVPSAAGIANGSFIYYDDAGWVPL